MASPQGVWWGEYVGRELTETVPFNANYMEFEVSQEVS